MWNPKINYTWVVGRHSLKTGYEFQHISDRGAGRQPALRPRHLHRPVLAAVGRSGRTTSTTWPTSCSASAANTPQQHPDREPAAADALHLHPGRLARQRHADGQCRHPVRVRDAALGGRQHPLQLRPGGEEDDHRLRRLARRPGARQSGSQQLRAASRLRLRRSTRRPSSAAAGASATSTSTGRAPRTSSRSTARRSSTRS